MKLLFSNLLRHGLLLAGLLLALPQCGQAQLRWRDAADLPLYGKVVDDPGYIRLPDSLRHISRPRLWELGHCTAGLYIRFRSNSTCIAARWETPNTNLMHHMCPTGTRGLDLYARVDGKWRFVNTGRPSWEKFTEATLISNMEPEEREYMLYLPLYASILSVEIGVDSLATLDAPALDAPRRDKPIVCYGTSILQGGCATRPGMAHTSILSRRVDREVINLGFSGNGQLDYEIARVMAEVDAGLFILDFVPNVNVQQIEERAETFYRILRDRHPSTPMIFLEDPHFTHTIFDKRVAEEVAKKNEAVRRFFRKLKQSGERNIYFIPSDRMIGDDGEATIDGVHFTDVGMMRYVDLIYPTVRKLLK